MFGRHRAILFRAALVLVAGGFAPSVSGLANRVFVSQRSGNDANTCDNILAPCQTFAGAVTKLNPGGEAIVLDSGGYGPVTITKSLTIEAPPGVTAFIHPPSGNAVNINAGASDKVVLRGLVLNGGPGSGIVANTVGALHVENCVVSGFVSHGILIQAAGSETFVKDTISRQNGGHGIALVGGHGASIDHCRFEGNAVDGCVVEGTEATISNSVAAGNVAQGFFALAAGPENTVLNVSQCVSTNNGGHGFIAETIGAGVVIARVANSSVSENTAGGLSNLGSAVTFESLGNNFVRGNTGGDTLGAIILVAAK